MSEHARARRVEVEQSFLSAMKALALLGTYMRIHRQFSTTHPRTRDVGLADPTLGRAGGGLTKRVFERLAIIAMRNAGRPLESADVVEELKRMGHPIGGTHEIKTAYNRLWEGKTRGVFQHVQGAGYWPADEPLQADAVQAAAVAKLARRKIKKKGGAQVGRRTGKPKGRQKALTDEEKELARKMLLSGKSVAEVANAFGVSSATLFLYFRGGVKGLKAKYPDEARPGRGLGQGRPRKKG